MLYNLTLCKACLQRLVTTNKFVRLKSHYAVLGISNTATQKDIRDAYIKLSKKLHPDQNRHDTKSHEKFVEINEAYEILSKDSSRQNYDDTLRMRNQPRQHHGSYRTSHRPPNYYSSGQFYEDQGPYREHSHYNPYSKRNTQSNYDPFSQNGYEHYQRQRKEEEFGPEDFGVDWKFIQTVSRIYSLFIAIPFYFGLFYVINDRSKRKTTRSRSHEFSYNAALKRLVVYYVVVYVICPYFVLANLFAYVFRDCHDFSSSDSNSGATTDGRVVLHIFLITFYLLAFLQFVFQVCENNNNKHPNAAYFGLIRYTILLLFVPYLVLRAVLLYGTIWYKETSNRSRTKPSYTRVSREERKAAEEQLRRYAQFFVIFLCVFTGLSVLTEDRSIVSRQRKTTRSRSHEFSYNAALKRLVVYYVVVYVICPYFVLANLFAYVFRDCHDFSSSDSNSGATTDGRVVLHAVLITFYLLAFLQFVFQVFENNNNKHPNAAYFGLIRYTILLLFVPYLVLRAVLLYGIMSKETSNRSRTKPTYTRVSREERKAAEEQLRRSAKFFVLFLCVFTGLSVLTEDRSIVSRQQQQNENGQNEERQTYTAAAEEKESADRIRVVFRRISLTMAILMAIFMIWEVIIDVHIKVMTRGLEEDDKHRKEQESWYNVFNAYSIVIRYATLIGIAFLYKKEAEAWARGTSSISKILLYLGLYASIVFFFGKQEVARRKQLKEQKSADGTKVHRKPTAGQDPS